MERLELAHAHAPTLILALLFGGAALVVVTPHARLSWLVGVLAAAAACAVAFSAAVSALLGRTEIAAPASEVFTFDGVAAFSAPLIVTLAAAALLAAGPALRSMIGRAAPFALALTLCTAGGWAGAVFARDLVGLVIGAQSGWLAGAVLVAMAGERDRGAVHGAFRMIAVGGAGAAIMVLGVACVSAAAGSLDVTAVSRAPVAAANLGTVGFVLLLAPLAMMAGLVPLHDWSTAAYGRGGPFAPLVVGTIGVIGALAVITRLAGYVAAAPAIAGGVAAALVVLGVASTVIGAVQAAGAMDVRRLVAYAGATQVGCILLAAALGSPAGLAAALMQTFAWAAAALALLAGAAAISGGRAESLDGLIRRAPLASLAITAGALSMMGAPLTIGFVGRWRLIEASVGAGWWWATGAAIIASLAAVFYGGRLIERIYFRRATTAAEADRDPWRFARAPAALVAILAIALGCAPALLIDAADRAAALVLRLGV
jgi:multicomponent Na+:H+ antiporter subunit D